MSSHVCIFNCKPAGTEVALRKGTCKSNNFFMNAVHMVDKGWMSVSCIIAVGALVHVLSHMRGDMKLKAGVGVEFFGA